MTVKDFHLGLSGMPLIDTVSVVESTVRTTLGILKKRDISSRLTIVLYDQDQYTTGLAHAILPTDFDLPSLVRYTNPVINIMIAKPIQRGTSLSDVRTVLIGGSQTIQFSTSESAADKQDKGAAKEHLARYDIPITQIEVRRQQGQIAAFDTTTDNTAVTTGGGGHS